MNNYKAIPSKNTTEKRPTASHERFTSEKERADSLVPPFQLLSIMIDHV